MLDLERTKPMMRAVEVCDVRVFRLTRRQILDTGKEVPYLVRNILTTNMITSKITSKAQTTIPQAVRDALRVREGDELAYRIERGRVVITKAKRTHADDPFATFGEWGSENDQRAYGKL